MQRDLTRSTLAVLFIGTLFATYSRTGIVTMAIMGGAFVLVLVLQQKFRLVAAARDEVHDPFGHARLDQEFQDPHGRLGCEA